MNTYRSIHSWLCHPNRWKYTTVWPRLQTQPDFRTRHTACHDHHSTLALHLNVGAATSQYNFIAFLMLDTKVLKQAPLATNLASFTCCGGLRLHYGYIQSFRTCEWGWMHLFSPKLSIRPSLSHFSPTCLSSCLGAQSENAVSGGKGHQPWAAPVFCIRSGGGCATHVASQPPAPHQPSAR